MLVPTIQETPDLSQIQNLITNLPAPAVASEIGRMAAEAQALAISDNVTLTQAKTLLSEVRKAKKGVTNWGNPYKDFLNGAKNTFMNVLKAYTDPLDSADTKLANGILAFERKVKEDAEALRRKQEAEAEERRKQEEAEAAALAATAMPWEEVPAPAPIVMQTVPVIPVAAIPQVSGVSTRKGPAKAEVADKRAFLEAALKDETGRMLEFVTFDGPALNAEARRMGKMVESAYPGVKFVQEEHISTR